MTGPDPCPFELDTAQPRPAGVPALVFNLRLHEGHGCGTEERLRRICEERGLLRKQ